MERDVSDALRLGELREAARVIGRYPWFGVGYGASPDADMFVGVSNAWLWIAERAGVLAAATALAVMVATLMRALRSVRDDPLVRACVAGLTALLVASMVDQHLASFPHLVVLGGALVGATLVAVRQTADVRVALDGRMLYRDRAGIGRYVWELQQAIADLDDRGHEVTLLLDPRDRSHRRAALPVRAAPAPARHPLERATLGWALRPFEAAHFPDHTLPPGVRVPSVVTVHDVSFLTHPAAYEPRSLDFYDAAIRRLSGAAQVITVSAHVRDQLLERRLVPDDRVSVIHEAPPTHPG